MNRKYRKYLHQLIGKRNLLRLSGATAGSLLGFFILMVALQLWFDARWFMQNDQDDLFAPGMVVVNKKISLLNTMGFTDNTFSDQEIEQIRGQSFVTQAEPFSPCRFRVSVKIDLGGMEVPNFVSEFFFESVPDELVDIPRDRWHWNPGSSVVPVVLPADFLKFYNFGFAPGQNLPQISEKTLQMAHLNITISGNGQEARFKGHIAGLSEKINTILVPSAFLTWANQHYGDQPSSQPTRLVLVSRVAADPNLASFIRQRNYETSQSELRSGKLNQLLQVSLLVTAIIGLVIIVLALYLFVLSFSLFIVRSDYEIRTLVQLGVPPASLVRYLFSMLGVMVLLIFILNSLFLHFAHGSVFHFLAEKGIGIMPHTHWISYVLAAILILGLLFINYLNIRKNIRRVSLR